MTTNSGATFKPIFDGAPTQAIGAIALDTGTRPPTIYVATGEGNYSESYYGQGIFKSAKPGVTWIQVAPKTFDRSVFSRLAIVPSRAPIPATIYAAVFGGGRQRGAGGSDLFGERSDQVRVVALHQRRHDLDPIPGWHFRMRALRKATRPPR
jgi:hypothetical protein